MAMAGMCCTLQAKANVQPVPQDSVHYESYMEKELMFQTAEPTYHKGVLVTSPWNGNWFVSLQGGASAFIGRPIGCADLFDRVQPSLSASVGKWFTPQIGARIGYGGWRFKDCNLTVNDYHHFHADLMYNVLGGLYAKKENPRWGIVPYVGLGMMYNPQNGQKPFAISYGIQGQYRICKRLAANDYSGLNSLRARLKNRRWDGKSPLSNDSLAVCSGIANVNVDDSGNSNEVQSDNLAKAQELTNMGGDSIATYNHSDYLSFINSGNECIGSPVYFFFELGTAKLTDKSQSVNLDELARVAKKYGLSVTVVGAADAATGTADVNDRLSISRADYITTELVKRGLAVDVITKVGKGGISDYNPTEANRHTKVLLYMK